MGKGSELETFVEHVYSTLLANEHLRKTTIKKNHTVVGRSKVGHEIDVYYEVCIAGVCHKVAIECKHHNRKLTKGIVQEFKAKLDDCNNLIGVMVTSVGYQSGARELAEHYGIRILTTDDLPKINELLATAVKWLLPDEESRGDPFWTVMKTKNGENTGTYVALEANMIPLFFSKKSAQAFLNKRGNIDAKVYGVTREHLKGICAMSEVKGFAIGVCPQICINNNNEKLVVLRYTYKQIYEEFFE